MSTDPELTRMRAAMDALNARLVDLLHERARLCRAIGAWKRAHGLPAIDPLREQQMLAAALADLPADGYGEQALGAILRAVFAASRSIVGEGR